MKQLGKSPVGSKFTVRPRPKDESEENTKENDKEDVREASPVRVPVGVPRVPTGVPRVVPDVKPKVHPRDEEEEQKEHLSDEGEMTKLTPNQLPKTLPTKRAGTDTVQSVFRMPTRSPKTPDGKAPKAKKSTATACSNSCSTPGGKLRTITKTNVVLGCRDFRPDDGCDFQGCKMCMKNYRNCKHCEKELDLSKFYTSAVLSKVYKDKLSGGDVSKEVCIAFENAFPVGLLRHQESVVLPLMKQDCELKIVRIKFIEENGIGTPFPEHVTKDTKKNKLELSKNQAHLKNFAKNSDGYPVNVTCGGCQMILVSNDKGVYTCPLATPCRDVCQTCYGSHRAREAHIQNFVCACGVVSEKRNSKYTFCLGCSQFFDVNKDVPEVLRTPHYEMDFTHGKSQAFNRSLDHNVKILDYYSTFFETSRKDMFVSLKTVRVNNISMCSVDMDVLNKKIIDIFAMLKKLADRMDALYNFLIAGQTATDTEMHLMAQRINKTGETKTKKDSYIDKDLKFTVPTKKKIGVSAADKNEDELVVEDVHTEVDPEEEPEEPEEPEE